MKKKSETTFYQQFYVFIKNIQENKNKNKFLVEEFKDIS